MALAKLSSEQRDAVCDALATAEPMTAPRQLTLRVREVLDRLRIERNDGAQLLELVDALVSLGQVYPPDGNEDETSSLVAHSPDLSLEDDERGDLERALSRVLSGAALSTLAKTRSLLLERERIFSDVRIITDVRPIFGDDVEPVGAIVTDVLRIGFFVGDEYKTIEIAVDADDLRAIEVAITRAASKVASLKNFLTAANMPVLEAEQWGDGQ